MIDDQQQTHSIPIQSLKYPRAAFTSSCTAHTYYGGTVHSVFQLTLRKINEDSHVVQEWDDIIGLPWSFLAVLDGPSHHVWFIIIADRHSIGHWGTYTSEYVSVALPDFIRASLCSLFADVSGAALDSPAISHLLCSLVERFDNELGQAVKRICPKPRRLNDTQAQALIEGPDGSILCRAKAGATVTAALVDGEKKHLWIIGLGDSSAGQARIILISLLCFKSVCWCFPSVYQMALAAAKY
jgi:pyruvate dehydrogenase phosphatase